MNNQTPEFWAGREFEKLLGSGTYGQVYLESCADLEEKRYSAAKVIRIPDDSHPMEQLMKDRPEELSEESWLHRIAADAGHRLKIVKSLRGKDGIAFLEDYKIIKTNGGFTVYTRSELLTPLEDYLKDNPPDEETALRFCLQISDAIARYEEAGIFHRNIKPSNLFVNSEGNFKLGDPAFPKIQMPQGEFISPEAPQKAAGAISDELYSLGAVAKKLFAPQGRLALVCEKACHTDPSKRFQSVEQFQDALVKISGETALIGYEEFKPALTKKRKKRSRRILVGMFLLGAVLVVCLTLYLRLGVLFFTNQTPNTGGAGGEVLVSLTQTPEGKTVMPDFSGLSANTVKASLERRGFLVKLAYDLSDKKANLVLGQSAPAGSALASPQEIWLLVSCKEEDKVTQRIRSVALPSDTLQLPRSETLSVTVTLAPETEDADQLRWSSSDPEIFTVENGVIHGISQGTATLTVTDVTGLARATATVTVTADTAQMPSLTGLTEEEAKKKLTSLGLTCTVLYEHGESEPYTVVAQSPESAATVTPGSDIILTVCLGKMDSSHVPVTDITLSHTSLQLNGKDSFFLIATLSPKNATNTNLSWLSSDKSVATVSNDGLVTAVSDGTATIRVISADGSKSAVCTVTVITASYTVVYDANGGSGTMAPATHIYRVSKQLSDCSFTRNGYSFSGWALTPDAREPDFINRQTVTDLSSENGAVVRLYAVWTPMEYVITYDANGGSLTAGSFRVTYGETFGQLKTPTREGYEFVGWYSNRKNGILIQGDTVVTSDSPTTLYARWRKLSDPVAENEVPEGATVVTDGAYWSYQITREESSLTPVNKPDWLLLKKEKGWLSQEELTVTRVLFPEGFDTSSPLYAKYNKEIPAQGETAASKVVYTKTETLGYLYWHWAQPSGGKLPSDRPIGQKKSNVFSVFSAFESPSLFPTRDQNQTSNNGLYFSNRGNTTDASWWWMGGKDLPVERISYTVSTYGTVYTYEVQETLTSQDKPTRSDAENITRWVRYYIYE